MALNLGINLGPLAQGVSTLLGPLGPVITSPLTKGVGPYWALTFRVILPNPKGCGPKGPLPLVIFHLGLIICCANYTVT